MGPGLVNGAADDDLWGIATYSQAGAQHGLGFLWSAVTTPLLPPAPEWGGLAVKHFRRADRAILAVLLFALILANALNIAADLVAIDLGVQLLHAEPTWPWALIGGGLITTLLILGSFARISLVFKLLCTALLAYLVVAVLVTHQWGSGLGHVIVRA